MTIEIKGNWQKGFAFDVHTLGSVYMGVDEFGYDRWDTTRTEMGELVYRLKYQNDRSSIAKIVDLLGKYKGLETMDAIVPIPSTNKQRPIKPVCEIAKELGKRVEVPVMLDALEKSHGGKELKNVDDSDERKRLLQEGIKLTGKHDLFDKNILLIDDLYRSGTTLTVASDILYKQAKVKDVFVLAMTKTRRKK
jgi:competence protein ComFC